MNIALLARRARPLSAVALVLASMVMLAGCAAPFGARHASPEAVRRSLTANVLSAGELSNFSMILLHRQNLVDAFEDEPEAALQALHERLGAGALPEGGLFSLSELSFHHADRGGGKPYFLAAAVYAYAFLFPDDPTHAPDRFDPRLRDAVDLYNRALTEAFEEPDGKYVAPAGGSFTLPFGKIDVAFDDEQLVWGQRHLIRFVPATETEVMGFQNRYRQPGIGAPLAAATEPLDPDHPAGDFVGPNVRIPVSMLLRLPNPSAQVASNRLAGELELHTISDPPTTTVGAWTVPLEQESTAALALTLTQARPWATNFAHFLGNVTQAELAPHFGGREPHRSGRIPVVFVHGTASNFSTWANTINDLDSDRAIRENFEFWFFNYDSGQPILYSGMQLRRMLAAAEEAFRADGEDPCLREMVIVGHSQGGLLVKLTAIDSGDKFWRNVSDEPIDEVDVSEETRALVKEVMFVEPLPFVDRVIFIATPHRGSYLAGPSIVRRLAQRLITLPATVARIGPELLGFDKVRRLGRMQTLPTSIDNMAPGHPFVATISKIPIDPDIAAHTIAGVVGGDSLEEGGDGVVKYQSAHIDGVESELVVPYPHSMQAQPEVVAEIERILHEHLETSACKNGKAE